MKKYDAIIIGAGPAGLSVGSELSKKFKVLVIDKSTIGNSYQTRDWTTSRQYLEQNGLAEFISTKYKKCSIKSVLGSKLFVYADFVTVDGTALLKKWADDITANGSRILEYCGFEKVLKNDMIGIDIQTNKGNFSSQLLIDCSGKDSALVHENDLYREVFYFPIYGGEYRIKLKNDDPCLLATATKRFPLYYFEIFPVTKNTCVFYSFQYLKNPKDPELLKKIHAIHLKDTYPANRIENKKKIKSISGVIPMGRMNKNSLDRTVFFGDSALMSNIIGGSGFTNILSHNKSFANHVSNCLKNDSLKEKDLKYQYSEQEILNRKIELILAHIILKMRASDYENYVRILHDLPDNMFLDLLFMRLTPKKCELLFIKTLETIDLDSIWRMEKSDHLRNSLDSFIEIIKELAIVTIKKI